jgi:glycosyltransferase involved in cell wall biosynthesis
MRILQIGNLGYEAGGAEKSMRLIKSELLARGHMVQVASTDKDLAGRESFADVTIPHITVTGPGKLVHYTWYERGRRELARIVRDFKPDVVHIHTVGEFTPSIFWALSGIPAVMTVHGPEGFTLKLLPWQLLPTDYRNHSYDPSDVRLIGRLRYGYFRLFQRPLYLIGLRRLSALIAPSRFLADVLTADAGRTPVVQIYNGIELPSPQPLESRPNVVYVGRLEAVKGVDHLVRAFAEVQAVIPAARLTIVGDGNERLALQQLATELDIASNVNFAGWVGITAVEKYYREAQAVVIPSVWPENLPTVAIEAMAIGRPIVGSNTGGIPELVDDGRTGFITPVRDADAIAVALITILSDAKRLESFAKASIAKSQIFDIAAFIDNLVDQYQGAMFEKGRRCRRSSQP